MKKFKRVELINDDNNICLLHDLHGKYLINGLLSLPRGFVSLDARYIPLIITFIRFSFFLLSRPWICYWILHALNLLNQEPKHLYPSLIKTINSFQATEGGYGGGPDQLSHW